MVWGVKCIARKFIYKQSRNIGKNIEAVVKAGRSRWKIENGHNKKICNGHIQKNVAEHVKKTYGFPGRGGCGLCQTGVPCESGIPTGQSK